MTVRELINKLLDEPMDKEVLLHYEKEHIDELGEKCSGYCFDIDDVKNGRIMFTDWRDRVQESEGRLMPCASYVTQRKLLKIIRGEIIHILMLL